MSYSNTGYCVLGRVIEVVTGQVWDDAMRELVFEPLGLTHTVTLPEQALRYRTAWGHTREPGQPPKLSPYWDDPRALGPAGSECISAEDLLRFARLHLDGGCAPDGRRVLSETAVAEMQRPQVDVPDRWGTSDHWGLGWMLQDWDGRRLYGHDGNTIGQSSFLTVVPEHRVAVALLANRSGASDFGAQVQAQILHELCGIARPAWPRPAQEQEVPAVGDILGRYERFGVRIEVDRDDGALRATTRLVEPLASQMPAKAKPVELEVRPSNAGGDVLVARPDGDGTWWPLVFFEIEGAVYLHHASRAQRRLSAEAGA